MRLTTILTAATLAASCLAAPAFAQSVPFVTIAIDNHPAPRTIKRDSVTSATGEFLGWVVSRVDRPGRPDAYVIEVATPLSPDRPRNVTLIGSEFATTGERYQIRYDFNTFARIMRQQNHG